jgi:hypothetical protein
MSAAGDDIGGRGEAIFIVQITNYHGRSRPYFRPHFLGEKFATLDYLVELLDAGPGTAYFFVQVKATARGYTKEDPPRLKVAVSQQDVGRMIRYPATTYVVGVDENQELAYIVSVHGTKGKKISSLPTRHRLEGENLQRLWEEVRSFWGARDMVRMTSFFSQ